MATELRELTSDWINLRYDARKHHRENTIAGAKAGQRFSVTTYFESTNWSSPKRTEVRFCDETGGFTCRDARDLIASSKIVEPASWLEWRMSHEGEEFNGSFTNEAILEALWARGGATADAMKAAFALVRDADEEQAEPTAA
jgi:hypothetical protein